eukprot:2369944-Amphidinium_carterae.1
MANTRPRAISAIDQSWQMRNRLGLRSRCWHWTQEKGWQGRRWQGRRSRVQEPGINGRRWQIRQG